MLLFTIKFQIPLSAAFVHYFKNGSCLPKRIYIALPFAAVKALFNLLHLVFIAVAVMVYCRRFGKVSEFIIQLDIGRAEEPVAESNSAFVADYAG